MPLTVIVGGQFGSEGKGKVATLEAHQMAKPFLVRCGGPNSGHTTFVRGRDVILRQLPSGANIGGATLIVAAGAVIDEKILVEETHLCGVSRDRLIVDPRAVLVEECDRISEQSIATTIGSTASGTGYAAIRRILRSGDVRLACNSEEIARVATVRKVAPILQDAIDQGESVIIEGTQGFGLSLLHGDGYPFVTSKDTTASAFVMEAGLSPRDVTDIILVVRTFPIRVAGMSGDLPNEIDWNRIREISGASQTEPEFTSVTRRLRRVGMFDMEMVVSACRYNKPTSIAVMGLDRLDHSIRGCNTPKSLTQSPSQFLESLIEHTGIPISWCGTGFSTFDVFNLSGTPKGIQHAG